MMSRRRRQQRLCLLIVAAAIHLSSSFTALHQQIRARAGPKTTICFADPPALTSLEDIAFQWVESADRSVPLRNREPGKFFDEIYTVDVNKEGGLGLILAEMYAADDGSNRGLVLVEEIVEGSNAAKAEGIAIGDTIIGINFGDESVGVEGMDWQRTVDALVGAEAETITLTLKRLVLRQKVRVSVTSGDGSSLGTFECLAGANLRMEFLKRGLSTNEIYDSETMRFDSIGNAGSNCGGEGTCGTCLVSFTNGLELIRPPGRVESMALKKQGRPTRWRWSCRAMVGMGNKGGDVSVQLKPQLAFSEERQKKVGL